MPLTQPSITGPSESIIRLMTRVSIQYNATNLSQGFPNEPPPRPVVEALARATLGGTTDIATSTDLTSLCPTTTGAGAGAEAEAEAEAAVLESRFSHAMPDELNQYSMPMGRPSLRKAIANSYARLYDWKDVDPETQVTITLGATEAIGSALRSLGKPGDKIGFFEPFHELYPSQCKIFYLDPSYVTLTKRSITEPVSNDDNNDNNDANEGETEWVFDWDQLEEVMKESAAFILNSPHNPTGKVFSHQELSRIANLALQYDTFIITDEIYEFMCYNNTQHYLLPQSFPQISDRVFMCNSIGKSCSATGWRVGWCIHPSNWSAVYRGVHDQSVVMAPHPMQYATEVYLNLPQAFFRETLPMRYVNRLNTLCKALASIGFDVTLPNGAYYLFAKYRGVERLKHMEPMEAAMFLVKEIGVACVPGTTFYGLAMEEGNQYLRFAACRSEEDINTACTKLITFFNSDS